MAVHVLDYLKEVLPTGPKAPWPTEGGRILLLGNGFSIDRDSAFHYDSLWNVASAAGALSPRAKDLAAKLGTTNFETVLAALETQRGRDKDIDEDIQGVRLALITALKKIHLEPHVAFSEHEIASCAFFLGQFKEVFTTNYDLLLYWISNKKHKLLGTGEEGALIQLFKDGFCLEGQVPDALAFARSVMLHPKEGTPQRGFHFLHGALHLLQQDGVAWKRRVRTAELMGHKFKLDYLRRDIVAAIERGHLPLFVSEGDSQRKLGRIRANNYLRFCYDRLQKGVTGDLVTFGFSFSAQDDHILEAIARNAAIRRIFVGARLYEAQPKEDLVKRVEHLRARREAIATTALLPYEPLDVLYYDASTACPWNSPLGKGDHPHWKK